MTRRQYCVQADEGQEGFVVEAYAMVMKAACISSIAKRELLYTLGDFNAKLDQSSAQYPVHNVAKENR